MMKQQYEAAIADYSKAIELNPTLAQAYANRAVVETLEGKKVEASRDFDTAFRLEPGLRKSFEKFLRRLQ
jgi:tetratricopeptide (TPR) repeat protein